MSSNQSTPKLKQKDPKFPSVVAGVYFIPKTASINLKRFIKPFAPLTEKTPTGNKLRRQNFGTCDGNGSGYCSLSDVESFVLTKMNDDYGKEDGYEYFKMYRASYIRAFNAAKDLGKGDGPEKDYVTYTEFRILNAYICIFAAMLDAFGKVDGGGKGMIDIEDDRRVDKEEWQKGYEGVQNSGFSGLEMILDDDHASIAFDTMDSDDKGLVLFREFCVYVRETELKSGTDLGKLLSGKVAPIAPKAAPNKNNTSRIKDGSSMTKKKLVVAGAYHPGLSCSKDLMDFLRVFQPLAEKTLVGKKDRQKKFAWADQNVNGYSSLAEIENFIKRALSGSFPRNASKDMFVRFRKSYIKAFSRAKSFHDSGDDHPDEIGEEYVTFQEFRIFNAYLCIYSALLDAFCRINATSDRIDMNEFIQSFNYVRDFGFTALASIASTNDATSMFNTIDKDNSGQVSYAEWCDYIIDVEIESDTELGKLMKLSLE